MRSTAPRRISSTAVPSCSTSPPSRMRGSNQCTKAVAAYKKLLPMMKKGTKDYDSVRKSAADPCHSASAKHSG